jgi:Icc-related predicted phosphoesterase
MKVTVTSDTHGFHKLCSMPSGRILLHAGDITRNGSIDEVVEFNYWLGTINYEHKIVIAGNHDFCFEKKPVESKRALTNATYLMDEAFELDGIKIYGSPWQPWFLDWAFNLHRGKLLREKWSNIPEDTDILITHGPPLGHGDKTVGGEYVGCEDLLARIKQIRPKLHLFGHIHEGQGTTHEGSTLCVNASFVDFQYDFAYDPFEVEIQS